MSRQDFQLADVSRYMFTDLLNCSPDAPSETIRIKFDRILSVAKLINDRAVINFLVACEAHYPNLLEASTKAKGEPA
jgi:hypothetical protein